MTPKFALLALALAILALPSASALDPSNTALGISLGDGTVQLLAAVEDHAPGDVLPLCQGDEAPQGAVLLGVVDEARACFDVLQSLAVGNNGAGPVCEILVGGGVWLFPEPGYAVPHVDEVCIYDLIAHVKSLLLDPMPELPVTVHVGG